jgi:hypothetical protein
MACYVDRCQDHGWKLGRSCHLIADTEAELHELAASIGMKRSWFQGEASSPHYDLTERRRAAAVRLGAVELDRLSFVCKIRELRAKRWASENSNDAETRLRAMVAARAELGLGAGRPKG